MEGGYALAAGTALPPLVVDDEEAMALASAIQSASATPGSSPLTPAWCRFTTETDSLGGPVFALGATGAAFRVVGPPELVERVRS